MIGIEIIAKTTDKTVRFYATSYFVVVMLLPKRIYMYSLIVGGLLHPCCIRELISGKEIQSIMTIVHVNLLDGIVVLIVPIHRASIKAETFAFFLDGLDFDYRIYRSIVGGSRILDDFHTLDVGRFDVIQLTDVLHLPAVDIYNRCTLADHLISIFLLHDTWHMLQYIFCRTHLAKHGSCHVGQQSFVGLLILRKMSFHHHFAKFFGELIK